MRSRREFVRSIGASIAAASVAAESLAAQATSAQGRSGSERLLVDNPLHPTPAPVGVDRLPLAWYKAQSQKLRDRARARGADAVLLQDDTNLVYFTGCFRGSGERTTWALLPVNETDTVYWFSPAIDRDLITSWWCTENDYYFCYPHAEGGFPNRGQLARGKRVDLWEWVLGKLAARGLGDRSIALDRELGPSAQRTWNRLLPSAHAIDISDECLAMQVIKTP